MKKQTRPKTSSRTETPLAVISKYYNKPSAKVNHPPESWNYHGKCCKGRSNHLGSSYTNKFSGRPIVKPPAEERNGKSDGQSSHTMETAISQTTLSEKSLQHLSKKFEQLSDSIIELATSPRSVGLRSLECLLTKEIQASLGNVVNDPKYSQRFFQSTRDLVERLLHVYDEGKINPRLIKDSSLGFSRHKFLKANSATSVCYKDKYFKELVMNVLQSMCFNNVEHEEAPPPCTKSLGAESRERIRAIREMVRVEAGLEPELFQKLDQRLEDLKRSLSENRLEILRASEYIERIASNNLLKRSSSNCVEIPKTAKTALMKNYNKYETKKSENNFMEKDGNKGCKLSASKNESEPSKNCMTRVEAYVFDLYNDDIFKCKAPDPFNIRKIIAELVEKDLLRKQDKCLFPNQPTHCDATSTKVENSLGSSAESCDSKSVEEEEIGDDDQMALIEVSNANFIKGIMLDKKISGDTLSNPPLQNACKSVIEISKLDPNIHYETSESCIDQNVIGNVNEELINRKIPDFVHKYAPIEPSKFNSDIEHQSLRTLETTNEDENNESSIHNFKCSSSDELRKHLIYKEMNQQFESFGKRAFMHEFLERMLTDLFVNEENHKKVKEASEMIEHEFKYTVEQTAKGLKKIIAKIDELRRYFKETEPRFSERQKADAYDFVVGLENSICNPNGSGSYDTDLLSKNDEYFILRLDNACSVLSYLIETLHCIPSHLKNQQLLLLSPPQSMLRTLISLTSMKYFKDCFVSEVSNNEQNSCDKEGVQRLDNELWAFPQLSRESQPMDQNQEVETGKCYDKNEQPFSGEISKTISELITNLNEDNYENTYEKVEYVFKNRPSFQHYLNHSASEISLKNVSDIFLYLYNMLKDVPERIKNEKILCLNPPCTLIKILDIIYSKNDPNYSDEKVDIASLTVQNVSDTFLTISKKCMNAPPLLKNSSILDLRLPEPLLRAVDLLTSPQHSILKGDKQYEI